ncbi:MAG: hypothetical protein ACKO96_29235, partial [Flammeovirgaceae bacterium]
MAGKGKSGKQATKSGAKKSSKVEPEKFRIANVTNGAIRRLARRGGVKRISYNVHDNVRSYISDFLDKVVRDSLTFAEHSRR